jgi:hypothetical protein
MVVGRMKDINARKMQKEKKLREHPFLCGKRPNKYPMS